MRTRLTLLILLPLLPIVSALARETHAQALPGLPTGTDLHAGGLLEIPTPVTPGIGMPPPSAQGPAGLEWRVKGNLLILDWTAMAGRPAEFRILHPGGRMIAARPGRRSAQGWIAAVRVAGWPRGIYLAQVRSGELAASTRILVP